MKTPQSAFDLLFSIVVISANVTVQNITASISIPALTGTTSAMTVNGWIIFQQRLDNTTVFDRNWTDYRDGFGSLGCNYWMGNEKVHLLTQAGTTYRLRIEMLFSNGWMSAEYDQFSLYNETSEYRLNVEGYSNGECEDTLHFEFGTQYWHDGMNFETYDRHNDNKPVNQQSCTAEYAGGWWYNNCYWCLLQSDVPGNIGWWTADSPIVTVSRMMIKPE